MTNLQRIKQVYQPKYMPQGIDLEQMFKDGTIHYFSYARWALYEGLKAAGLKKGDRVLLPEFICRDLLAPLNQLELEIHFYPLNKDMSPAWGIGKFPAAKAIVVVNFFVRLGCDIDFFRRYCDEHSAILVEDNAHGFLSRDTSGRWLGTRGDLGIFSFRKTFPLKDGGGLYVPHNFSLQGKVEKIPARKLELIENFNSKDLMRQALPLIGVKGIQLLTSGLRFGRKLLKGNEMLQDDPECEKLIPELKAPLDLKQYLSHFDGNEEVKKRLELFALLKELLLNCPIEPLFEELPLNCVPYSYPFYCHKNKIAEVQEELKEIGLECFQWPSLPEAVRSNCPDFYRELWLVRLLW